MKRLSFVLVALLGAWSASGCRPGQIFGPPTRHAAIEAANQMVPDSLKIFINADEMQPRLTADHPVHQWWKEIQTMDQYYSSTNVRYGTVYALAWNFRLGRLSQTQTATAETDRVTHFDFGPYNFPPTAAAPYRVAMSPVDTVTVIPSNWGLGQRRGRFVITPSRDAQPTIDLIDPKVMINGKIITVRPDSLPPQ